MKFFTKIVYFLISIGSNTERRKSRIDYGNMAMITFYFIQLLGYIFSQFESKSILYYENDYLAQIGQYSSIPFIMIIIQYDPFTIIMYIGIFSTMVFVFTAMIIQVAFKALEKTHPVNRFIKFYFQTFQWYFLTPFDECMIGVKTCGSLAYLKMHTTLDPSLCWTEVSLWFVVPSLIGQVLVICSGFLCLYCFRNYEFIQGDLNRKFTYLNFLTIFLHMMLQMSYFWREEYNHFDETKHTILCVTLLIIGLDNYLNLPFGFSNETVFFSKSLVCSLLFEILVIIWLFSNKNDGIIFITFTILVPLVFGAVQRYYDNYFDKECLKFCHTQSQNSEYCLEYLCSLCHQENMAQQDCILMLKYMKVHCDQCKDLYCPCRQKISKFVTGPFSLNVYSIYQWIQYQFQQKIKFQSHDFEYLAIKYVTFLQRYRENQVLSQKIILDIVSQFQKSQTSHPYFFMNLTKRIQFENKKDIEQANRVGIQITQSEFRTLQDINLFYTYEEQIIHSLAQLLQSQKQLWVAKIKNSVTYDQLLSHSGDIIMKTNKIKKLFYKFQDLRELPKLDSILILRIRLLISIVCMEDLTVTMRLARKISAMETEQNGIKVASFTNPLFFQGQALSVVTKVSASTLGQITQKPNDQFFNFFGYEIDQIKLTTVEQLLPPDIGKIHNGLIENYLQIGKTNRFYSNSEQFIYNSENLIEKVNICLSYTFPFQRDQYNFYCVAHLLKIMKYQKGINDVNKKGYILVNSEFFVFGMTKNIYERINYKYFFKDQDSDIVLPEEIYGLFTIQQLIPQIQTKFEEYYKLQALHNQKRIIKQDVICSRDNAVLVIPKGSQNILKTCVSFSTQKLTNKHMINALKDATKTSFATPISSKQFPIEYSVTQRVLNPLINDTVREFLYFIVELEFTDDVKITQSPSQINAQTPALSEILRRQRAQISAERPNQSNLIISNDDNDHVELMAEMTNTGTRRSQGELIEQIEQIVIHMNVNILPQSIKNLIAQLILQTILFLAIIITISNLFQHKKDIQSGCIQQITQDLNFLDAYSETMAGSRHVIYYRDFYSIIPDSQLSNTKSSINITKYDKIYMAWQQINKGLMRLINMNENYSKIAENSQVLQLNLYIISHDLQSKIVQQVESYATYYQIMYQIFYMAYQSFASSPDVYLSGTNDSYFTQIARSIVFYNFFDVATNANSTLNDCQIYNSEINSYFDTVVNCVFIGTYFIILLQLIALTIFYFRISQSIKLYLKLFKLCDQDDCAHCVQRCDQLLCIVNFDRILLRQSDFQTILNQPQNVFDNLKKSSNKTIVLIKKKRKDQEQTHNSNFKFLCPIIVLALISFCQLLYVLSFHLFYQNLQQNISPINNRALDAQQMRLNFLVSVNRLDFYFVKTYFESQSSVMSENIKTDTFLLNLVDINQTTVNEDVFRLQSINFAQLLLEDYNSLSSTQEQMLLGSDVCNLTGCNMQEELLSDRLYQSEISPLFYEGVVSLHQIVLQMFQGSTTLIQQTNSSLATTLETILDDNTYILYILWGIDVIQYQISEFSQYFIDLSLQNLVQLTQYNQLAIIYIGVVLLILILICEFLFVKFQINKHKLSKAILKFIPLPILFQKNIPKHLVNFQRKYKN